MNGPGNELFLATSPLSRSLSGQVSRNIGEGIFDGQFVPGQSLPDEIALCEQFGVSRTVIREAVKMLVAKGLLEVRQWVGTRVQNVRNWQMLDRDVLMWHQSLTIADDQLLSLMELRQSVEPDAAYYAAARYTEVQIDAIESATVSISQHVGDTSEYVLSDATFHVAVLRAAKTKSCFPGKRDLRRSDAVNPDHQSQQEAKSAIHTAAPGDCRCDQGTRP